MGTNWKADMKCSNCGHIDQCRDLPSMTRQEALDAPLNCPNCDTVDGLQTIPSTLRPDKQIPTRVV